ncbi:MAG: hypothetical protein BWY71_01754 [Planctomycetes bacterium ADurb.Bin412]|nr:MAG: hypothetical protein BWY71_01754 [Planctomycetes bacterium ADurb.Bin412]
MESTHVGVQICRLPSQAGDLVVMETIGQKTFKRFHRPVAQSLDAFGDGLFELHIGLDLAFDGVGNRAAVRPFGAVELGAAAAEDLIAHQDGIFQIDMEEGTFEGVVDDAGGRLAARLGEIQREEAAIFQQNFGVAIKTGIAALQGIIRTGDGTILKNRVIAIAFFRIFRPDIRSGGIAPPVETHEKAAAGNDRFVGPADVSADTEAAEAAGADAILGDSGEFDTLAARHVPADTTLGAGGINIAENPAVEEFAGKFQVAFVRTPPVDAFQAPLGGRVALNNLPGPFAGVIAQNHRWSAGILHHPAGDAGAIAAVEVADQDIVGALGTFEGRVEVGFVVGIGANDDHMAALIVRNGLDGGLDRVEGLLPTAAVGIVAQFGDIDGDSFMAGVIGGRRIERCGIEHGGMAQNQR